MNAIKKVASIMSIVTGGIIALGGLVLFVIICVEGTGSTGYVPYTFWNGWTWQTIWIPGRRTVDIGILLAVIAVIALAACIIVFSSLLLRRNRRSKGMAITVLVLTSVMLLLGIIGIINAGNVGVDIGVFFVMLAQIAVIVLIWVYLVQSGKHLKEQKAKKDEANT